MLGKKRYRKPRIIRLGSVFYRINKRPGEVGHIYARLYQDPKKLTDWSAVVYGTNGTVIRNFPPSSGFMHMVERIRDFENEQHKVELQNVRNNSMVLQP